jgi:RNA polymerase sigma-70 factor (ECF subfamily)
VAGVGRVSGAWTRSGGGPGPTRHLAELARQLDLRDGSPGDSVSDSDGRRSPTTPAAVFTCCHPALAATPAWRSRCASVRPDDRGDRPRFLSSPSRWPSASSAPRRRSATRGSRTRAARGPSCGRLDAVLQVVYLVFNEGYAASSGDALTRADLAAEAIRLGRLLVDCCPSRKPACSRSCCGTTHGARRGRATPVSSCCWRTRTGPGGTASGLPRARRWSSGAAVAAVGPYTLQAAIAAVHAEAPSADGTDWRRSWGCTTCCARRAVAVVELNRAARCDADGPAAGLTLVDAILARELGAYHRAHAARRTCGRRLAGSTRRERATTGAGDGTARARAAVPDAPLRSWRRPPARATTP